MTGVAKKHPRPKLAARGVPDGRDRPAPASQGPRRILVADGDAERVASTAYLLAAAGYRVSTVQSADETRRALRRERYDLVVLGGVLADASGLDTLADIRAHTRPDVFGTSTDTVGVMILLDGQREDAEAQRYLALGQGADDVLTHPFQTSEFLLRAASILRRAAASPVLSSDIFRLDELYIDFGGHHAMVEDQVIDLTRREFALLRTLAERPGYLCTRDRLRDSADGRHSRASQTRTIDMQISRLRRKLGVAGDMIENVRGEGYRLGRLRQGAQP